MRGISMLKKMKWDIFFRSLLLLALAHSLHASSAVVAHDQEYFLHDEEEFALIYTQENLPYAVHTAQVAGGLTQEYADFFSWDLDEKLYIGLISSHNQIPNGFSSQWPKNRQINYIGGTELIDQFSSISWLDTLLYHESAHNYQMNVKGSKFSQILHSLFGNGNVLLPYLTVPNIMENPFMLEGNAVLNESWHKNGGRLYNGRYKAQTILQAKADKIKAKNVYNYSLTFPYYSDMWYIQGGFYNLYLAQKYGMKNLNSYFKHNSRKFFWPLLTNKSMRDAIGISFEASLNAFADEYKQLGEYFISQEGEEVLRSQFFYPLNSDAEEIFFLTNETGLRSPELITLDKKTKTLTQKRDSWRTGKVIKMHDRFYTQASAYTSVLRISQGLYDADGFLKKGSDSQMVQGYLSDQRSVFFDVNSSFMQAQLYVGKDFYDQVNSSVLIDKEDSIYYFKQKGKTRTLYKNKEPLFSYEGYYGIISDVDSKGNIYFIANSALGSSLYRWDGTEFSRASLADNIVEVKLLSDQEALFACISDTNYYYTLDALTFSKQAPYETKLFFEDKEYYQKKKSTPPLSQPTLEHSYSPLGEIEYSGTDLSLGTTEESFIANIALNFADPLSQNSASISFLHDENNTSLVGASYTNEQYLLSYSLGVYQVLANEKTIDTRDNGVMLQALLPLYRSGYNKIALSTNFYQDYELSTRESLSVTLEFLQAYQYGLSLYPNYRNQARVYYSLLKEAEIYGFDYTYSHDLGSQFYLGLELKQSISNAKEGGFNSGVKITSGSNTLFGDSSDIIIPSLRATSYVKEAGYAGVSIHKVFDLSSYWFTFPLSLQREALYAKHRYYEILGFSDTLYKMHESSVGLTLYSVFLNKNIVPISLEYIYNDADFLQERHKVRAFVNFGF